MRALRLYLVLAALLVAGCFRFDFPAACTDDPTPCAQADSDASDLADGAAETSNGDTRTDTSGDTRIDGGGDTTIDTADGAEVAIDSSSSETTLIDATDGGCVPSTCASLGGKDCGDIPDGCGGTLHCGFCAGPGTCGGGGTPNVCGFKILAIDAGGDATCAVKGDGDLLCWGSNAWSTINSTGLDAKVANTIAVGGVVTQVAVGGDSICARLSDATVKCWGANSSGQLGDGTTTPHSTPTTVPGLSGVRTIVAGGSAACAIMTSSGAVKCWGDNNKGKLGDGTTTNKLSPTDIPGLTGVSELALGDSHSCAKLITGIVKCWGGNIRGTLGDGLTADRLTPAPVSGSDSWASVSADSGKVTCGIIGGGAAKCWGMNDHGQIGNSTSGADQIVPTSVIDATSSAPITGLTAISSNYAHSCALKSGGGIACWGWNLYGQIGDTTTTDRPNPITVIGSGMGAVTTGGGHSCALDADGLGMKCWGDNGHGQLGDGTLVGKKAPVAVRLF